MSLQGDAINLLHQMVMQHGKVPLHPNEMEEGDIGSETQARKRGNTEG